MGGPARSACRRSLIERSEYIYDDAALRLQAALSIGLLLRQPRSACSLTSIVDLRLITIRGASRAATGAAFLLHQLLAHQCAGAARPPARFERCRGLRPRPALVCTHKCSNYRLRRIFKCSAEAIEQLRCPGRVSCAAFSTHQIRRVAEAGFEPTTFGA